MYILLLSIHGLIRGHELELGRDADTGGQTLYVVDLARALAERDDVDQVDLITRRVVDPAVSADYAEPIEPLSDKARVVRIDAGPEEYIAKEQLWDHLDGFMDNLVAALNARGRMPDLVHSHYADAGYVGVRLSSLLGVPLVYTGHSLGRDKRQRLLSAGLSDEAINKTYNMDRRVDAEEEVLASADLVIASTNNEIDEQYGLYDYYQPKRMAVIAPGTDLSRFHPQTSDDAPIAFADEVRRFLAHTEKPLILALSRADPRKNIQTLLAAYGESEALQEAANLLIIAGNRDDIHDLDQGAQSVLTELLFGIDTYDLYGRVAMPKHHRQEEVPEIYRLVAEGGGVFINPALTEPFGLTLLEAAASGLPLVATENGGPVDIIGNCDNGILVDPLDKTAIAEALLKLFTDKNGYRRMRQQGIVQVREEYSWYAHAERYVTRAMPLLKRHEPIPLAPKRKKRYRDRALFTDLDQSLLGDADGVRQFATVMREHRKCATFGIATGRRLDSALAELRRHGIPRPDVLITSLGTEIHYAPQLSRDEYWKEHVDYLWRPVAVRRVLSELPGLTPQPKSEQTRFKVSYHYDPDHAPCIEDIAALLRSEDLTANLTHAFGQFLDVIPSRASKGQALRYVAQRWGIPLERILVAGGSGADEDMMRGNTLAVVVANRHDEELSQLEDQERIYFAGRAHALGIIEAIEHYDFFGELQASDLWMKTMHPIHIFGEVLFDCFPDGREVLGGAPFNVAWHLQAFRQSPVFVSSVGDDDAGRRIRDAMSAWGMTADALQVDPGHPTGRVTVTLDRGEPSYEIVADSAYDFIAPEALSAAEPGLIYHGSLALRNPVSKAALDRLKSQAKASVFVDVNLRSPWWRRDGVVQMLDDADWVKLNRDELALLGDGGADEIAAAERFLATHGLKGLVLTLGAEGALALTEGGEPVVVRPVSATRVVDAVGAGDAFAAVLILGLRLGWPLETTIERAQGFASELVQRRGATVSDPGLYRPFVKQWGLTSK